MTLNFLPMFFDVHISKSIELVRLTASTLQYKLATSRVFTLFSSHVTTYVANHLKQPKAILTLR